MFTTPEVKPSFYFKTRKTGGCLAHCCTLSLCYLGADDQHRNPNIYTEIIQWATNQGVVQLPQKSSLFPKFPVYKNKRLSTWCAKILSYCYFTIVDFMLTTGKGAGFCQQNVLQRILCLHDMLVNPVGKYTCLTSPHSYTQQENRSTCER